MSRLRKKLAHLAETGIEYRLEGLDVTVKTTEVMAEKRKANDEWTEMAGKVKRGRKSEGATENPIEEPQSKAGSKLEGTVESTKEEPQSKTPNKAKRGRKSEGATDIPTDDPQSKSARKLAGIVKITKNKSPSITPNKTLKKAPKLDGAMDSTKEEPPNKTPSKTPKETLKKTPKQQITSSLLPKIVDTPSGKMNLLIEDSSEDEISFKTPPLTVKSSKLVEMTDESHCTPSNSQQKTPRLTKSAHKRITPTNMQTRSGRKSSIKTTPSSLKKKKL